MYDVVDKFCPDLSVTNVADNFNLLRIRFAIIHKTPVRNNLWKSHFSQFLLTTLVLLWYDVIEESLFILP